MASITDEVWAYIRALIPDLNSSVTSITGRIVETTSAFLDIVALEVSTRSPEIIARTARANRILTPSWYLDKSYAYQEGDPLVPINDLTEEIGYATIDPTKQIIKQANIGSNSTGSFYLNVATADADNNVIPLTTDQLNSFRAYIREFTVIGTQAQINSNPPAIFSADNLYIRYGSLFNLTTIKSEVSRVLHDIQVQRRDTNRLYINDVEGALRDIEGVTDAYMSNPTLTYGGSTEVPTDGSFTLEPGYFNFDPDFYDFDSGKTIFELSDAVQVS